MNRNITIGLEISKIDEEQRRVYGIATSETLDSQGDILDYEASKTAVSEWMKTGNIREMHDGKKAVGKAFDAQFNDDTKEITVGAYISRSADGENTWQKVKEGILSGFSVGGKMIKTATEKLKSADGVESTIQRVVDWKMSELSLVDSPANPSAKILMVKSADGDSLNYVDRDEFLKALDATLAKRFPAKAEVEQLPVAWWAEKFQNPEITKEAMREYDVNQLAKMEKRDFTDAERKDLADQGKALPDGSFPIANKADLANAIKAVGRAKDQAAAKAHIVKRAKALGATNLLPDSWKKSTEADMEKAEKVETLRKDFFGVATLVDVALSLQYFKACEMEEGDETTVAAVEAALQAIKTAAESELAELSDDEVLVMADTIAAGQTAMDLAKKEGRIRKGGAAVTDGDPRDATAAPVTEATPVVPKKGGTPVTRTIVHADNTKTVVTKSEDGTYSLDEDALEKLIASKPLPEKPKKVENPAADDIEATRAADTDADKASIDADGKPGAPSGNDAGVADVPAPNGSAAPTGTGDGSVDASTEANGSGSADAPKAAEAAAGASPATRAAGDPTGADAPSPATDADRATVGGDKPPTDDGDDEKDKKDRDKDASDISTLTKVVSDLQTKFADLNKSDEIAKAVNDTLELTKEIAKSQSDLEKRLVTLEKQPAAGSRPLSAAYPVEVIKGREESVHTELGDQYGMSKAEIVGLIKQRDHFIAHPSEGTEAERGAVMRKLYKVKDLPEYEKLITK